MKIFDIALCAPDVTLAIKASQLKEFAEELITKATEAAENAAKVKQDDKLVTTEEAMKILSVSKTTLWRWKKADVIHAVRVGGNDRYRMSEITRLMEGGKR